MCVVLDINVLQSVFEESAQLHHEFKPVFEWICKGKGKIVYGGTQYIGELPAKYFNLFAQFRTARKAILVDSQRVDQKAEEVSKMIVHRDFDDQHIVGLLQVSGCKIIVSLDERAYPFFRHSLFFSPASRKPKIYKGRRNAQLLSDNNVASICLPCRMTTREQRLQLGI